MPKSPEELRQLMKEADPDGSGEVDFEEFVAVLKKQIGEGGGGLLSAFSGVSSLLGLLNPLSWFAPPPPPPPPAPPPRPSPVEVYGGGTWVFGHWIPPWVKRSRGSPRGALAAPDTQRQLESPVHV